MKRLKVITILFSVCVFVLSVNSAVFAASPIETQSGNTPVEFHDETCLGVQVSPVFDASGAFLSVPRGISLENLNAECRSVAALGSDIRIAPVFDASGNVVSDPTGTILSVIHP